MIYHHTQTLSLGGSKRNVFNILGKDHEGNYWISCALLPWARVKMEEELDKFKLA